MKTYEDFKATYLGRAVDIDGYYGAQCWDGAMFYSQWLGYPVFHCNDGTGYARDIWTGRHRSGILNYYDEVEILQPGDIVVFREYPGYTPLSHIAIFDRDAGNSFGIFLGQNQGGAGGAFNLATLPYAATYQTAFRPKCFADQPSNEKPFEEVLEPIENGGSGSVYRLYNPGSGDHLYTLNIDEARGCQNAGWTYEGIAWIAPADGDPVYRLYINGRHVYTADVAERKALVIKGAADEGIAFMSGGPDDIWRMYNPNTGDHLLTASRDEHNSLSKAGWYCEGQKLKGKAI